MRKLKNSRKILSILFLGSFLISLLILPNFNNVLILSSEQKSSTQDKITPEQISPIQDDNPTKPLAQDSAPIFNQTFSISQSEDDAFFRILPAPSGTFCDKTNMSLGAKDKNAPYPLVFYTQGIGLRWNINVPKYATITKAYINLTIANLTFLGVPWTGFNTSISAFNESSTNDFSNTEELFIIRPQTSDLPWELNGTEIINQTIKTTNIADLLQQVMDLDGWDGIFGAMMLAGVGTEDDELIQFWSYDYGKPEYYPKLYVEWKNIPRFLKTPEDMYVIERNSGYSLKWKIGDNNPDTFKIDCNVSMPDIPYYDTWTSGWVTYDLPLLERGFYNFTAYFNDTDGNLIWDSIIIEAGKPQGIYKINRSDDDAWYKPEAPAFGAAGTDLLLGGSTTKTDINQRITCLRFNTMIPKHVRIKRAYVNLTVSSVASYTGFTSNIYLFYPPVVDFSDDNVLFTLDPKFCNYRPEGTQVPWTLLAGLSGGDTIQTPDIASELQEIIDFGSYDGYIGLYIIPTANVAAGELVKTYSYEGAIAAGKTQYTPTLYVEWEETPYFVSVPADVTAKNGIRGYHLDWTATDNNPTTFTITCNRSVSNIPPGSTIYSGVWQSGVKNSYNLIHMEKETNTNEIRYDLPPLDIGSYNFTIRINDVYGNYNTSSVIVNVKDIDIPVLTDIKFIQNGKEVDYFQCGNGPFSLRIYNSTTITPRLILDAYYPAYNQYFYSLGYDTIFGKNPIMLDISVVGDTKFPIPFDSSFFSYNPALGYNEISTAGDYNYEWWNFAWNSIHFERKEIHYKKVGSIEYNVLNRFEININSGTEYIYNNTIYGGIWDNLIKKVWNKDLTPPLYSDPEFIEPDEPDKHYEVNLFTGPEAYGAEIDYVFLYYSIDNGPWEETKMVLKDGIYYAEIPAQEEGATIDYYIRITDIAGNSIKTDEYHEKAPTFEEPSIIIPIVGILLGILGSLSIVAIYRHKNKAALKKLRSEKIPKKSKKGLKLGNKLLQKIKKVRKKQ